MGTKTFYVDFGCKLANLREEKGLTQTEFAHKIGVSRASVANIERGQQRVYLHHLISFANALELPSIAELTPSTDFKFVSPAQVSVSGDKISSAQTRAIKELVGAITASSKAQLRK